MAVEGTYLEEIMAKHRRRASADSRDRKRLRREAIAKASEASFGLALAAPERLSLIAECKRRSPSRGDLAVISDPRALGLSYQEAGAAAISVLTDEAYFSGSLKDLDDISSSVAIPCLRKDFTVDVVDLYDARIHGAGAVLLIVAALSEFELRTLLEEALEVGLDVLVEVHSAPEIELAQLVGSRIIGINQRNLFDFSVDESAGSALIGEIEPSVTKVLESGIIRVEQVHEAKQAGFDAILVGEALVRSGSPLEGATAFAQAGRR